jgi:hypothetical protein
VEEVDQLRKRMTEYFGPALRALSDEYNHDFLVVWEVGENFDVPGEVEVVIWPHPEKAFHISIRGEVDEGNGRWTFESASGRWQFRVIPEAKAFARSFKRAQSYRG